ncbi:farnesol dehydrogenase-like isoform X2 [Haematobia irritans]|uniref:farnesol dehydrogenase-like isoform X2 n=1 Tax=Haematobia irritans TaxID=7368 RepID=UPI003F500D17
MQRWLNKVAVVTGASSGIGSAVIKDLLKNGIRVVGLARRYERVEDLKKDLSPEVQNHLTAIKCDVCSWQSVNKAFDQIIDELGGVDILVNNAGLYQPGQLATMDIMKAQKVLQTNVMGVVNCTQRAFKSMKERRVDGHVILINSMTGHYIPTYNGIEAPNLNMYAPSKFALRAMRDIYRQEFIGLGTKIKITSVSPGLVDTEMVPDFVKAEAGSVILKPEDISSSIMYAIATPPHVQVHEMIVKPVGEVM